MASSRGVRFTYRGHAEESRRDEPLLTALLDRRFPILTRSNRYRRPRGPFCGIGQCTGCLVRVNGHPGVRACRAVPSTGDAVESERGWPSPRWDLLGGIDFVFPSGLDALRGLRRPAFLTSVYQWGVRRLLGGGRVPDSPGPTPAAAPMRLTSTDIAVVGAGASGRAIAAALVRAGRRPTVFDRTLAPIDIPGCDVSPRAAVTFLPARAPDAAAPFTLLGYSEPAASLALRARTVVVATGSFDAGLLFGGNDRPGVLTAEAALAFPGPGPRPTFRRAVVVGGGARAHRVLAELGDRVAAVVAPGGIRPEVVRRASELEIPLYPRSLLLATEGRARVRRVELRTRGFGPRFALACDAVVLAHRRLPNSQLLFQAGARMAWNDAAGAYYPVVDPNGSTSVPGLFAVGSVAGADGPIAQEVADRIARALGEGRAPSDSTSPAAPAPVGEIVGYYRELLAESRTGRWFACPCEDVLLDEVEAAVRNGYRGIEVIKRYTGLGTGLCQGRYCVADTLLVLSLLEERAPSEVGFITQRPPVFPTPLGALAGLPDDPDAEAGT